MRTGYYVAMSHHHDMNDKIEEDTADEIVRDIANTDGDIGIKSGITGEIGCSLPPADNERKGIKLTYEE